MSWAWGNEFIVMEEQIVVSILCTAYNHEPYIRQCLDGFVMQKTNFKFEAIVHEDASTDNTAFVIREYAEKYPDIIVPIYQTENQYRKTNIYSTYLYPRCKGKYIAICEGDDYWTDPYKLQKQVDFLDANSDYSLCFANAIEHWEDGSKDDRCFSNVEDRDYTGVEIYKKWTIPTASVVYRKEIAFSDRFKEVTSNRNFIFGDIVWFLTCAEFGKLRGMSDIVSVYRRHDNGMTIAKLKDWDLKFLKHHIAIYEVFNIFVELYHVDFLSRFFVYSLLRRKNVLIGYRLLFFSLKKSFFRTIKIIFITIGKIIKNKIKI